MKLRIVQIEVEAEAGADVAELIRAASGGQQIATLSAPPIEAPAQRPQLAAAAPTPAAPVLTAERAPVKIVHRGRPKKAPAVRREAASTSAAHPAVTGGGDSISQRILDALAKKPMSTLELRDYLKVEPQPIYGANNVLKSKGLIESRNDPADGTRRWFLVAK